MTVALTVLTILGHVLADLPYPVDPVLAGHIAGEVGNCKLDTQYRFIGVYANNKHMNASSTPDRQALWASMTWPYVDIGDATHIFGDADQKLEIVTRFKADKTPDFLGRDSCEVGGVWFYRVKP